MGGATVVVDTGLGSVVGKAVVVEVDLVDTLLERADNGVEGAKSIRVDRAAGVRARDGDDGIVARDIHD